MTVRRVPPDQVRVLDRADITEGGLCFYARGTSDAGETVLWTFDPSEPVGLQERVVVSDV